MTNPFHYFASFRNTEEDRSKFFGRQEEENRLVEIFRKSPVSIITGPSGSGKTSLIECGLFQRMGIQDREVNKIRFDKDEHVGSLLIKLFNKWDKELASIFALMLKNYSRPEELHLFLKEKSNTESFLEVLRDENSKQKLSTFLDKDIYPIFSEVFLSEAISNKNGYNYNYLEDVYDLIKHSLKIAFDKRMRYLANDQWTGSRYLLFDQFEEYYSLRSYSEIKKQNGFSIDNEYFAIKETDAIGLVVNTILDRLLSLKVIISFKEEYLGPFESFKKWIPNLHKIKYRINLPDREELNVNILQKYFQKFKINPQEGVLEHILEAVKKLGVNQRYQLPFVQMYLFELFEYAVANEHISEGEVILKKEGIERFISIRDVVRQKVDNIAVSLINKMEGSKIPKITFDEARDFILRVLREFKTDGDSKRRFRYINDKVVDFELRGVEKNSSLLNYIPFCAMELVNEKLIRYEAKEQYLELAHDTLSEIIDQFEIGKDYLEILKENFNSNFELFQSSKSSGSEHMLSKSLINRISYDDLKIIVTEKDGTTNNDKTIFWDKSIKYHNSKERINWLKNLFIFIIGVSLILSSYFLLDAVAAKREAKNATKNTKLQVEKSEIEVKIFQGVANAYRAGKYDRKTAYDLLYLDPAELIPLTNEIKEDSVFIWDVFEDFFNGESKSDSINQDSLKIEAIRILNTDERYILRRLFFEDLEGNLDKRSFYINSIDLPENHRIIASKSRKLNRSNETLAIYAQTNSYLLQTNYNLMSNSLFFTSDRLSGKISAFEPFYFEDSSRVLASRNDSLILLDDSLKIITATNVGRAFGLIESLGGNKFLCLSRDKKKLFTFNLNNSKLSKYDKHAGHFNSEDIILISYLIEFKETIFQIRTAQKEDRIYRITADGSIYGMKFSDIGFIKYTKVQQNGEILISDASSIYKIKSSDINEEMGVKKFTPSLLVHGDDENWEIRTIDSEGDKIIVGTQGNIAQIYHNAGNTNQTAFRQQKLIGHSDDILSVSFFGEGDFALTSSHGGSIKIWDISDKSIASEEIETKNNGISKLMYRDSSLYIGFRCINHEDSDDSGYILELDKDLDCAIQKYYYRGFKFKKNIELPSFDFADDGSIAAGTFWSKSIRNAQPRGSKVSSIRPETNSTVRDVRIQGVFMAVGTDNGIELFKKDKGKYHKQKLTGENDAQINAVDIDLKSERIIAAGEDANIYIWDLNAFELDTILYEHLDRVTDVCFSPDGKYFVSGSWDNKAIVWQLDPDSGKYVSSKVLKVHGSDIEDIAISNDNIIASASSDNTVQLHKVFYGDDKSLTVKRLTSLISHNVSIRAVTFGANSNILYTGDKEGVIKKWDRLQF